MAELLRQRLRSDATYQYPVQVRTCKFAWSCQTGMMPLMTLPVDHIRSGYPQLAAFQSSDDVHAIYRRYNYLQARLILEKQANLHILEQQLDQYDESDINRFTRDLDQEDLLPRAEILDKIEKAFESYGRTPSKILGD